MHSQHICHQSGSVAALRFQPTSQLNCQWRLIVACWSVSCILWRDLRHCFSPPPRAHQGTEQGFGSVPKFKSLVQFSLAKPWSLGCRAPALSTPLLQVMSSQVGCLLYVSFAITGLINILIHCGWLQLEGSNRQDY